MNWKTTETCPVELENGIVIDYVNDNFVMLLKDDIWSEFECDAFLHHKMNIGFIYERVCAIFLLEVEDGIEVSDVSFDIHNCEEAKELLASDDCYHIELYLLDAKNTVCASRKITLSRQTTTMIKNTLQRQLDTPYDDEGFDRSLMKIQGTSQPYELMERSAVIESFKGI